MNFPFIYEPEKSIDVYKETIHYLDENSDIKNRILDLSYIFLSIRDLIPHTIDNMWSGHYFPISEAWDELQVSYTLCQFGLYKQAMTSLRSGLELGVLSVYYNINDEGHNTVKKWITSDDNKEADTPRNSEIWKILESHPNIKSFQIEIDLKNHFFDLGFLHNYVHTKGYRFSNEIGLVKSNFQTFQIEGLNKWLETYESIVIFITTLHLLKYPIGLVKYDYSKKFSIDIPSFSKLNAAQIERIEAILPKNYLIKLKEISNYDIETQNFIEWVKSHPDMTENEIEEQIIRQEKEWIKREGIYKWKEEQLKIYNILIENEMPEKLKNRIDNLTEWALKYGYTKSIYDK